MLHVTNGDSAAESLMSAGIRDALCWRDCLHEGPVVSDMSADELCQVRARFLSECGWGAEAELAQQMRIRDAALLAADEVTLWFEHDLYDQLQLLQILSILNGRRAFLAQADTYLGPMQGDEIRALSDTVRPITSEQQGVALEAWDAFRSADLAAVPNCLRSDASCLPYLHSAFLRLLQERPGSADGLSRTERQILKAVATEPTTFAELYMRTQQMEEAVFAGDEQVMLSVKRLADCETPLLSMGSWRLTAAGREVQAGAANHMRLNRVDRWVGGIRFVS